MIDQKNKPNIYSKLRINAESHYTTETHHAVHPSRLTIYLPTSLNQNPIQNSRNEKMESGILFYL